MATNKIWIDEIATLTNTLITTATHFQQLTPAVLNYKTDEKSWSILECVEHLNRYSAFYLPEIKKQVGKGKKVSVSTPFKSGVLGGYFAKSMRPKEKLNKMKTFASKNPVGSNLNEKVLAIFVQQQHDFLALLEKARTVDLKRTTTGTTLGRLVRFRLGDTLLFYAYHNWRHIEQAKRMMDLVEIKV